MLAARTRKPMVEGVRMVGIERRIREEYGDAYWEEHKNTILSRTKAPQDRVKYPSRMRRDMRRHPENYSERELREAGIYDPEELGDPDELAQWNEDEEEDEDEDEDENEEPDAEDEYN